MPFNECIFLFGAPEIEIANISRAYYPNAMAVVLANAPLFPNLYLNKESAHKINNEFSTVYLAIIIKFMFISYVLR